MSKLKVLWSRIHPFHRPAIIAFVLLDIMMLIVAIIGAHNQ